MQENDALLSLNPEIIKKSMLSNSFSKFHFSYSMVLGLKHKDEMISYLVFVDKLFKIEVNNSCLAYFTKEA